MTTQEAFERWAAGRDPEDGVDGARGLAHEQRMERAGLTRCDDCGDWSSDAVPCVREVTMVNAGYAAQDVPVRCGTLCGECQKEQGAVPDGEF